MRSGTTLLHRLLGTHADIYVPGTRKEIHFFDKNYDKGLAWYAEFFPQEARGSGYRAVGEVTPRYVFEKEVPHLIRHDLPEARFILILRNPVERLYSHYRFVSARSEREMTFREFASGNTAAVSRGFYAEQLTRWLELFPRDRFLIFLFEEFVNHPDAAVGDLADFLGVDPGGFDKRVFDRKAAASLTPRLPRLYKAGIWLQRFLLERDLDKTYAVLRAGRGLLKRSGGTTSIEKLSASLRRELHEVYAKDISTLETMLERDLQVWRPGEAETNGAEHPALVENRLIQ